MSRFRASLIHLGICALVAAALLVMFWFVWYPEPLFHAVGGYEIFLLVLAIDVTLGPLLTLVVFNSAKRTLKFDLAVIGAVQVAALAYGVYVLLAARPVYVASLGNRFVVVQANDVRDADLLLAKKSLPWFGPEWVGFKVAADQAEHERIMLGGLGGASYGHFPQHHASLESMRAETLRNALPISELRSRNLTRTAEISEWLRARGYSDDAVVYQALVARSRNMSVILEAKTAKVVGIAPFNPRG
jgi:hypothetical protein